MEEKIADIISVFILGVMAVQNGSGSTCVGGLRAAVREIWSRRKFVHT